MDAFSLVIFGITSNLAQIKLIPALYDLAEKNLLPKDIRILGVARKPMGEAEFKQYIETVVRAENRHHQHDIKKDVLDHLLTLMHYQAGDVGDNSFYPALKTTLDQTTAEGNACYNHIFYLATYPDLYHTIFEQLQASGLNNQEKGWVRLMIEKPIGNDLQSAKALNALLLQYFSEDQIYRLDHYLGKETLQNILTFRFGNGIFEPLFNAEYVDHIQVTALEDFGIGKRGGYYDSVGSLKDVGQNHLLQMLAFATMSAPKEFSNQAITEERVKILRELVPHPEALVLGQYEGYTDEAHVKANSSTDTYFAFKTELKNERFRGVPMYVRGGKKLAQTATEISVVFKNPHNRLFGHLHAGNEPSVLIFRIQPNEAIVLKILTKKPGLDVELETAYMQFCYRELATELPDPYERLIYDCLSGNQTFFNDSAEVEAEWAFIDPLVRKSMKPALYKPGSYGPKQANQLIEADGRAWLEPSMAFCKI